MTALDTLIIGAGMAGLTAAGYLHAQQRSFLVLDKGRGVGGRVATRRLGEARADHGAPCFRLDHAAVAEAWSTALVSLRTVSAPAALDAKGLTCPAGINALAKALAQGLPVALRQTVSKLERSRDRWRICTEEGQEYEAHRVLITSPLWQSARLFKDRQAELAPRIETLAQELGYQGQWTLLVSPSADAIASSGSAVYQTFDHPAIASVYAQGSDLQRVWIVQATKTWSQQQLEADPRAIESTLTADLSALGWDMHGAEVQAHRWRYARVKTPLGKNFLQFDGAPGIYFAGDFCLGSTVMQAAASGLHAAHHLCS